MANRRELKKDLNWLTHEVITDCMIYLEMNPEKEEEPIAQIINNLLIKRNEALIKINMPTTKMAKNEVKAMYKTVIGDFLGITNGCFEELSKIAKK